MKIINRGRLPCLQCFIFKDEKFTFLVKNFSKFIINVNEHEMTNDQSEEPRENLVVWANIPRNDL